MTNLQPACRLVFFMEHDDGTRSIEDILEFSMGATEAVQHVRQCRWAPVYRGKLFTIENGYQDADDPTSPILFFYPRPTRPTRFPR